MISIKCRRDTRLPVEADDLVLPGRVVAVSDTGVNAPAHVDVALALAGAVLRPRVRGALAHAGPPIEAHELVGAAGSDASAPADVSTDGTLLSHAHLTPVGVNVHVLAGITGKRAVAGIINQIPGRACTHLGVIRMRDTDTGATVGNAGASCQFEVVTGLADALPVLQLFVGATRRDTLRPVNADVLVRRARLNACATADDQRTRADALAAEKHKALS